MSPDPPYKTLVVGHSYVHWLRAFVETLFHGSGFTDFVVDGYRCDVEFLGVRCATVNTFFGDGHVCADSPCSSILRLSLPWRKFVRQAINLSQPVQLPTFSGAPFGT